MSAKIGQSSGNSGGGGSDAIISKPTFTGGGSDVSHVHDDLNGSGPPGSYFRQAAKLESTLAPPAPNPESATIDAGQGDPLSPRTNRVEATFDTGAEPPAAEKPSDADLQFLQQQFRVPEPGTRGGGC